MREACSKAVGLFLIPQCYYKFKIQSRDVIRIFIKYLMASKYHKSIGSCEIQLGISIRLQNLHFGQYSYTSMLKGPPNYGRLPTSMTLQYCHRLPS